MTWQPDILGDGFEATSFEATGDDGVARTATLVRYRPAGVPGAKASDRRRAVLFLHGWSDYFFNVELAGFWADHGYEFYALDMHNHGRSLRPESPGGYVANLADYDAEISKAISIIGADGTLHGRTDCRPLGQRPPRSGFAADPEQPVAGNARQFAGAPGRFHDGGADGPVPP
jgi:alpha-beta hydrolase superfamily lysophospholipase